MQAADRERICLPLFSDIDRLRPIRGRKMTLGNWLLLRETWSSCILMHLFDLFDPVSDRLLMLIQSSRIHSSLLASMSDHDFHVRSWTLHESLLVLS